MAKRYKMSGNHSRSQFTRTAKGAHKKNYMSSAAGPMRGGIRL